MSDSKIKKKSSSRVSSSYFIEYLKLILLIGQSEFVLIHCHSVHPMSVECVGVALQLNTPWVKLSHVTKNIQKETIREIKKGIRKKMMKLFFYRDMSHEWSKNDESYKEKNKERHESFETFWKFFMVPVVTFSGFRNELK